MNSKSVHLRAVNDSSVAIDSAHQHQDVDVVGVSANMKNITTSKTGGGMSDISREELDARLAQSKAETELIATNMRREMAEWREQQNSQMSQLNLAIATISSKIDGKMDSVDGDVKAINGKFEGIQGQITGINTAISGIQAGISIRLAIFGAVIAVIVALPSIFSAFKDSPTPQQAVSQPIVIQIPQQQATPPQVQSQDKSK